MNIEDLFPDFEKPFSLATRGPVALSNTGEFLYVAIGAGLAGSHNGFVKVRTADLSLHSHHLTKQVTAVYTNGYKTRRSTVSNMQVYNDMIFLSIGPGGTQYNYVDQTLEKKVRPTNHPNYLLAYEDRGSRFVLKWNKTLNTPAFAVGSTFSADLIGSAIPYNGGWIFLEDGMSCIDTSTWSRADYDTKTEPFVRCTNRLM